jgi:hypothetical protein
VLEDFEEKEVSVVDGEGLVEVDCRGRYIVMKRKRDC